jgi:WS/DGAT/MGAT family acyltransferase
VRQLTSLDTQFLALESSRQAGHVASLVILDPSTAPDGRLTCREMKALLRKRLPMLPPMRWRLTEVPLNLDYPYWVDDPDFDLDYHVRELALPRPGSDAQLAAQVARITARPLDRARPLWEAYVIDGLASGHVALLIKIHHAVIDGMSGAEILGILLDLDADPDRRELPPVDGSGDAGGVPRAGRAARPRPARRAEVPAARPAGAADDAPERRRRPRHLRRHPRRGHRRAASRAPSSPSSGATCRRSTGRGSAPRRRRSTAASRPTGASRSGACRSRRSRRSRTRTA